MLILRRYSALLAFFSLCLLFSGCSMLDIREQTELIEGVGTIKGKVKSTSAQKGTIIVLRYRDHNGTPVLENKMAVSENGNYKFNVSPAGYCLAAFIDSNNDGLYQENEHGNYLGTPDVITVSEKETVELDSIIISGPVPKPATDIKATDATSAIIKNIGRVTSMDDPAFKRENYTMGMWRPIDFLEKVGGGLFMLQPYQSSKIPILFVHGVNGGPTDWQTTIASLDTKKFQPWVLYYPSGFRLDIISDYFLQAVVLMQKKHHFKQLVVVAHSMGGLVTRSFVKKYLEQYPTISKNLKFIMTINSPMGGMPSAALGLRHSPIISAAWYDVAPGSEFLQTIHGWQWPETIPYHLVFSFKEDKGGDGVVSLQSQLPAKLQSESVRMYGFSTDHVGTLSDPGFLTLFNDLLDDGLN